VSPPSMLDALDHLGKPTAGRSISRPQQHEHGRPASGELQASGEHLGELRGGLGSSETLARGSDHHTVP
jgi:hypothetical protein